MVNESLRIPLWELVYHDCSVNYPYWCDHNSKVMPQWDKRDLFNCLYGTSPMFLFNESNWENYKHRFAQSYKTAATVAKMTGYEQMVDHRYLTDDMTVQQTVFSNEVRVTVNFGDREYKGIPAMGYKIDREELGFPMWAIALISVAGFYILATLYCFLLKKVSGKKKDSSSSTLNQEIV